MDVVATQVSAIHKQISISYGKINMVVVSVCWRIMS